MAESSAPLHDSLDNLRVVSVSCPVWWFPRHCHSPCRLRALAHQVTVFFLSPLLALSWQYVSVNQLVTHSIESVARVVAMCPVVIPPFSFSLSPVSTSPFCTAAMNCLSLDSEYVHISLSVWLTLCFPGESAFKYLGH